ncbi:MAG: hypothetical protein ACT4P3_09305 [Betaproteobacteria bacterium]
MRRQHGRLLELPILAALGLVGLAWVASVSSRLGLTLAAVVAAAFAALFAAGWTVRRRERAQARRRLEQTAAAHGLAIGVRQEGKVDISGGMLGIDRSMRKLAFATREAAAVAGFDRVRSVSVGVARALGQSAPSWYSIDLGIEGEKDGFSIATTSRRRARKWLDQLGEALGEDRVRDARAMLN